jgi:phosphate starvation-inducible PhoH-like protein
VLIIYWGTPYFYDSLSKIKIVEEFIISIESINEMRAILGRHDAHIKMIEESTGSRIIVKDYSLIIQGEKDAVCSSKKVLTDLKSKYQTNHHLRKEDVAILLKSDKDKTQDKMNQPWAIHVASKKQVIIPKTEGQKQYVAAMRNCDVVFCIGPAGTGKTYLAMAMAIEHLSMEKVSRIILTRPAIEAAGETLGFLPGDISEKVGPYLRPLYDALYDMVDPEKIQKYVDKGVIEMAPLAYMRGRTLNDAFVILDEAQNATSEQMKMFLTRMGFDCKIVITGDITQSDLPGGKATGLLQSETILKQIPGIRFIRLTVNDVVRHELVQKIISAYQDAL